MRSAGKVIAGALIGVTMMGASYAVGVMSRPDAARNDATGAPVASPVASTFGCRVEFTDSKGRTTRAPGPIGEGYREYRFEWPGDNDAVEGFVACQMMAAAKPPWPTHWTRMSDGGVIDSRTGEEIPADDKRLAPWR